MAPSLPSAFRRSLGRIASAAIAAVTLAGGLLTAAPVADAANPSMTSSFQVLNLSDTTDAAITIHYYNPDGSEAVTPVPTDTVPKSSSKTYFPIHAPAGFSGSVVIESTEQVVAISNIQANTSAIALDSYAGFSQGGTKLYFPQLQKGNSGNNSTITVQNASTADVTVTLAFVPEPGSTYATVSPIAGTVIKAGAATSWDMSGMSQFGTKWVGSATATVTSPATGTIAGVASLLNLNNANAARLSTYRGFTAGSTTALAPLIQQANSGNRTSINCQNLDPNQTTTITATYTSEPGGSAKSNDTKAGVVPNGLAVFLQPDTGTKFVGSARVTSSPSVPLACVINSEKNSGRAPTGLAASYEAFDPSSATTRLVVPLIQSKNGRAGPGFIWSSINAATVDGSQASSITVSFRPNPGISTPADQSKTNTAASVFLFSDVFGNGNKYVGGAVVTSDKPIVAVVNQAMEQGADVQDYFSSYDAFNTTP